MAQGTPAARDGALVATGTAVALIAQQVASKATRDALFLSSFSADELPKAMAAAAALSVVAVFATARLHALHGPQRVVPPLLWVSAALFGLEWWALPAMPGAVAAALYLHVAVFGAIVVSGFWSVVNEEFDPHEAKTAVARIGGGATLGGVVGGFGASAISHWTDVRATLVALLVLNVAAAIGLARLGRPRPDGASPRRRDPDARNGLAVLRDHPYLRTLGALVLLTSVGAALLDFSLKAYAAAAHGSDRELMRFFGAFYSAASVGTFLLQTLVGKRLLQRVGLAGTVAVLPAAVLVLTTAAGLVARLAAVAVARAAQMMLENSLYRSGYELLYTPVAPRDKRPTKTLIDVGFDRAGDAAGSGLILAGLAFVPNTHPAFVFAAAGVAVVALLFSMRLHDGYVAQLATSLRDGTVELDESDVVDATTRRTLTETTMALDREKLLSQIREFRASQRPPGAPEPPPATPDGTALAAPPPGPDEPALASLRRLLSNDLVALRDELRADLDPRLAAFVVPLVGRSDVGRDALEALRRLGSRVAGQVVDALLDPSQPFAVRRRLPRVLAHADGERVLAGLLAGLEDARFEVRYQCGRALTALVAREPGLEVPGERVLAAVQREIDVGRSVWQGQRLLDRPGDDDPFVPLVRDRVDRSLEHVFGLLGLVFDRDTIALCFRALSSGDQNLRGTALEYLENVLPTRIRERLWPHLGVGARERRGDRQRDQIVEDLLRSLEGVPLDPALLPGKPDDR